MNPTKTSYLKLLSFMMFSIMLMKAGYAQSDEIKIRFIGNCGLHMTDGELNVYVDFPYESGAYGYMEYDSEELGAVKENSIFLFTHTHNDHHSKTALKEILKSKGGEKFTQWNLSKLRKLGDTISGFSIEPLKTKHRFTIRHCSYLITWHGKRIYLSGDTESAETIGMQEDIDLAFVPSWILLNAQENDIDIDAKRFAVYHLYPDEMFENEMPKNVELMEEQGEMVLVSGVQ